MVGRELRRILGSAFGSDCKPDATNHVFLNLKAWTARKTSREDTYLCCIGRKEMRKLEVCKVLERDDFKGRVREIHLSNQLILGFTLALDDSLVLVFF